MYKVYKSGLRIFSQKNFLTRSKTAQVTVYDWFQQVVRGGTNI